MVYFKIGTTEFSGDLAPSEIIPSVEIIKNEERSLNGTMNVDVVARKIKLTVSWNFLNGDSMKKLSVLEQSASVLEVQFFDAETAALKTIHAYVDGIDYTPFFDGKIIRWRDISLTLVEI